MSTRGDRGGWGRSEAIVAAGVVVLLLAVGLPFARDLREKARQATCRGRMGRLVASALDYEQTHDHLPAAAVWDATALHNPALHESRHWHRFIRENWAIELLPHSSRSELWSRYDASVPVSAESNAGLRTTRIAELTCPSDETAPATSRFEWFPHEGVAIAFARGNYAINGGTHSWYTHTGNTTSPTGDHAYLETDAERRTFRLWGNGIAGFNRSFRLEEFENGQATLIAFNELRAGIDPLDPRGVWGLGHIAASITWGHGINGDAGGPNHPGSRSDDIQNCATLHEKYGGRQLAEWGMPCVSYIDLNQNATSRSRHPGGVHAAFLDGAVRFVPNGIDPSLWHILHARATPRDRVTGDVASLLEWTGAADEADAPSSSRAGLTEERLPNSLGMEFVRIAAGEFRMGTPDLALESTPPEETPAHRVRLTSDYYLGATEVTRDQYARVMSRSGMVGEADESASLPVTGVTWEEAVAFCQKVSEQPEERAADRSYRLPTEAEWEFACRERSSAPYPHRPVRTLEDTSGAAAGVHPPLPVTPVGSYPPNALGLYDLRGNVWEWCADWFDRDYYARSRTDDPAGPAHGYAKVVRGGDWIYVGEGCFINYPMLPPWLSSPVIGFRVVCIVR